MIKGFKCKETKKIFNEKVSRKFPADIQQIVFRKLEMIDASVKVKNLAVPPGNRLKKLKGERAGQYSVRVNDQWRICFRWKEGNIYDVELCDYH
ncbi:MAG: type II toxin-antitoxin system RelE/ParE family toxin [Nitrospinota bacterium]